LPANSCQKWSRKFFSAADAAVVIGVLCDENIGAVNAGL
jgi:hypothetical protein